MYIVIACVIVLLILILLLIVGAMGRKRRLQEEIEAMLVSEMALEERMMQLAEGSASKAYLEQSNDYLPPPNMQQTGINDPGLMLSGAQMPPVQNGAIGLNSGAQPSADGNNMQLPPPPDTTGGSGM